MICGFLEQEYDQSSKNIEIAIDRSFIKEPGPSTFWQEYVRLAHLNRQEGPSRSHPKGLETADHPYIASIERSLGSPISATCCGITLAFVDSKTSIGIQIADICAQICRRFHGGDTASKPMNCCESES